MFGLRKMTFDTDFIRDYRTLPLDSRLRIAGLATEISLVLNLLKKISSSRLAAGLRDFLPEFSKSAVLITFFIFGLLLGRPAMPHVSEN